MSLVFDGKIDVHYRFIHLSARGEAQLDTDATAGQTNGLCGAQIAGQLSFVTGLHTGKVRFAIEWLETEPSVDASWEDVVEAPFLITQTDLALSAFEEFIDVTVPVTGPHRARFNATGMEEGNAQDTADVGESGPDRYLLQLWPAPSMPDAIIRQTSEFASYWHQHAQGGR